MKRFFWAIVISVFLLVFFMLPASANTVSQTFDFIEVTPTFTVTDYMNTPGIFTFKETGKYSISSSQFPSDIIRRTVFETRIGYDTSHFTIHEKYVFPNAQIFDEQNITLYYYCRYVNQDLATHTTDCNVSINGQALTFDRATSNNYGVYYMFHSSFTFSKVDVIEVSITYEASSSWPTTENQGVFYSYLSPFTLSQDVTTAEQYSRALYTAIDTGISPTLDHIEGIATIIQQQSEAQAESLSSIDTFLSEDLQSTVVSALAEQEQAEADFAQDVGESSVQQAMALFPQDEVMSYGSSVSAFLNSWLSTSREPRIAFPQIFLPAIDDVMDYRVLYSGSLIDLVSFFDEIPESILILVRSFVTASLIFFIVKELMHLPIEIMDGTGAREREL